MSNNGYCKKCKAHKFANNFCPDCGSEMISSFAKCPHCSKTIYISSSFCEHCGRPVQEEMSAIREGKG